MTRPETANGAIIPVARLPAAVLFELHWTTVAWKRAIVGSVRKANDDPTIPTTSATRNIAEPPAVPGVQLPPELQEQLRQARAQWIRTLVGPILEADGNDE